MSNAKKNLYIPADDYKQNFTQTKQFKQNLEELLISRTGSRTPVSVIFSLKCFKCENMVHFPSACPSMGCHRVAH